MKLFAALAFACLLAGAPPAQAVKAALSMDVAAGSWKTVRLRGLPKNGSLAVRVESSGPLRVFLIHEKELRRLPEPVQPAFAGSLERRLAFKVTLPVAGTYYVVLDNRRSAESRSIRLSFEALAPRGARPRTPPRPGVQDGASPI